MENIKLFLFSRWMTTNYADEHLDDNLRHSSDPDFDYKTAMSVLNTESGTWYLQKIKYFNDKVYPNYQENGTVEETKKFFKENNTAW